MEVGRKPSLGAATRGDAEHSLENLRRRTAEVCESSAGIAHPEEFRLG
jgi:hypothetical protein